MSTTIEARLVETGTKSRIFAQPRFLGIFDEPEILYVSVPPNIFKPGPADDRMFVVDAKNKLPYSQVSRAPDVGERFTEVQPIPEGHFGHLDPDSREFSAATMY